MTFTIITVAANELMKKIHDRMPVILKQSDEKNWLNEADPNKLKQFLKPFASDQMKAFEISTLVNSPRNNGPEIIKAVGQKTIFS